ncbi:MAG TPA: L,D-transpeptidase family protein [Rhodoblastus sp.]|nr:L,D-transpeptidase family protein [Rhodoblastus sp.]
MSQRTKKAALRSGATALVAGAALSLAGADVAAAQGFWNLFAPQPAPRVQPVQPAPAPAARPRRVRDLSTPARYKNPDLTKSAGLLPESAKGPITIVVSTDRQHLTVYDGDKAVSDTVVSTGVADHPTPYGVFSIIEKQVFHRSTLYDDAPMPFMQRLTWSGVALHEGHVTGRPASHGCIRLPAAYAKDLYRFTRRGVRVVIAREDAKPMPLTEFASVFQAPPKRYVMGDAVEAERTPGEIEGPAATVGNYQVKTTRDLAAAMPISVLVNRKAGKLYVRRNFKPLFEVPIDIDQPDRPIGAHMFVAQAADGGGTAWSSLSVASRTREAMLGPGAKRAGDVSSFGVAPSAADALKRIHIAPGVAARLAGIAGPGAVFIISDEGARNKESWDGTNFIALVD